MIVDSHLRSAALAHKRDGRGGRASRITGAWGTQPPQDGGKGTQPPYRPLTAAAGGACEAGEDCPAADRRYRPRNTGPDPGLRGLRSTLIRGRREGRRHFPKRPGGRLANWRGRIPGARPGRNAMELDFHGPRTHWNRGSTALWCQARAQHALLGAARVAQRAGRSWRLPGGRASASKSPVSYASTTAWTRSRRLSFCRMCVICVLTVVSLM